MKVTIYCARKIKLASSLSFFVFSFLGALGKCLANPPLAVEWGTRRSPSLPIFLSSLEGATATTLALAHSSLSLSLYICIFRVVRTIAGPMKSRGKKEEEKPSRSSRLPLNWLPSDHNWGRRAPERGTIWRSTSVAHNNEDGKIVGANRREKKKKDREGL